MSSKTFVTCFFLAVAFLWTSVISAEVVQYENQVIERIDVVMMNTAEGAACDASSITARIKSRVGDLFSQSVFDNDLKILAADFDRIDPIVDSVNGRVFILLRVWPKPTIRTITWNGNAKISTYHLQKELGITSCSIFDRLAFNRAFHKLKAYYVKEGFFEAELSYDVVPVPDSNEVDIIITINEGRAGRIKKIQFLNFTKEEEDALVDKMITKEYFFLTSWMTGDGTYHEEAIQQDEITIVNFLQDEGYADAKVTIDVSEAPQSDRIIITIIADRGSLYLFGNISVTGNKLFTEEQIRDRFLIQEGKHYSPARLHETVKRITNAYGRRGYIDAVINYEPKLVHEDLCVYDIELTIEEGEQYRVGLIKVLGNCSTQTRVILHETLLIPGEIFNTDKLERTEERLENIGYFKSVNVYAVKSEGPCALGDNYRDVHIEVEETGTGNFGAFAGFSTSENLFGGFNITESNFNYKGLGSVFSKGLCSLRGGGEYAYFTATLGTKSTSYLLSWTKPWFMDTPWIVGFDLEHATVSYVSKDYEIDTNSLKLRGAYQLNPFMRVGVHYRLKQPIVHVDKDRLEDSSSHSHDSSSSESESSEEREEKQAKELEHEADNHSLISAVGASWTYDSTNHPVLPTEGLKSRLESEFVGLGGENHYFKFGYSNTFYWQFRNIDWWGVWKVRADLRYIQPVGSTKPTDISIDERYFLGGDTLIRGYRPYKLGPELKGDPVGGISMQYYSLEYGRPLFKKLDVFYFLDGGYLSNRRWGYPGRGHPGSLFLAVGWGFRVSIFPSIPPVVLGMGYPLNETSSGQRKRFFISVGGQF